MEVITVSKWLEMSAKGVKFKFVERNDKGSGTVWVDESTGKKYLVNKDGYIK